ncbi:UDP-N-acetylmuramoyl-tripeptide--D-alanyl-D-alanine ligase [Sphingobacterium sp. LRF_L2]|uniref:UDP-N-acetylmuramoyl-tripeptide--D-alanyl-D- alanine ligase n=1 Tax=Sphingobacterium sp. LRF_L2 TaxID=3369421 RepID=UPI003F617D3A
MTIEKLYQYYKESTSVSTDTRNIALGSIFFALKGEKFNANEFAAKALEAGAKYAVVDEAQYAVDGRYLLVDNALEALQELAKMHRRHLSIPVIGITGTNGKTTTKELLYSVLSQKFNVYATKGNLNNHIGVPLTLLAIDDTIEIAVIEMGANHQLEIAFLCGIADPAYGLITNVGKAHLEGFGSFEGVKKTKGELYDYLKLKDGVLFLQGDNPHLVEMEESRHIHKVVRYGFSSGNNIVGKLNVANPFLTISWSLGDTGAVHTVSTKLTGSYNTENILAAAAVGNFFGLTDVQINEGIALYTPTNNRSQLTKTDRNLIIADYYNANASSMAAALDNIAVIHADQKAIVLGDMFEMGEESWEEHRKVVEAALAIPAHRIIFVGEAFYQHGNDKAEFYRSTEEAKKALEFKPVDASTVLLKASRGMAFERLIDVL